MRPNSPAKTAVMPGAAGMRLDAHVLKAAGVVALSGIMSNLDITVVSVALPTFQSDFRASYANVAWTITAYTLALAVVMPLSGWAADRFGAKRVYVTALVLFVLGSALCSTAWDIGALIIFRVLQGLGGGMLSPVGMTIVTRIAGPERVGRVMSVLAVPILLGPIGGPILGGWLIGAAGWHWIFLINVPIGCAALVWALIVLPADGPGRPEWFDFPGMLLLSPGLALFLFGVSSVPVEKTVVAIRVLLPGCIGLALVAAFVRHALRHEHPLIDLRLFASRQLAISMAALVLFSIAFVGVWLLMPTYFQQIRGQGTLNAGLLVAPVGLGAMLTMPVASRLADRIAIRKIVVPGLAIVAAGMGVQTQISPHTSYPLIIAALFAMGLGLGATSMPLLTAALRTLTPHTAARGTALVYILATVANSTGVAVMSVILTSQIGSSRLAEIAVASRTSPLAAITLTRAQLARGLADAAHGFDTTCTAALILLAVAAVPAALLPHRRSPGHARLLDSGPER
jgi:EmrB/QacA subfamily drug resistance transporter